MDQCDMLDYHFRHARVQWAINNPLGSDADNWWHFIHKEYHLLVHSTTREILIVFEDIKKQKILLSLLLLLFRIGKMNMFRFFRTRIK